MKPYVLKLKTFISDNERVLLPLFLLLGFLIDAVTLRRVDLLPETILVYSYLTLAGGAILLSHLYEAGVLWKKLGDRIAPLLPLLSSYAFGALFSAFTVFYMKSALISDSWPFIAALALAVVGLEIFKKYQARLLFNLGLYFLAIFSFCIFSVPLWVGKLGAEVFFLSALAAVGSFALFCFVLYITGRRRFLADLKGVLYTTGITLTLMSVLYTTNTLPPIPLVLKDIGVYHYVAKDGESYKLLGEQISVFDRIFGVTIHWVKNEPVYVFSSVFTPVAIDTEIVHRWEYWSTIENEWVFSNKVAFAADGGRDEGYRGYSFKRGVFPGRWRVTVETPDGLKIGRIEFSLVEVVQVPSIGTSVR